MYLAVVLAASSSASSIGCMSSGTQIRPGTTDGAPVRLTEEQTASLIDAIEESLSALGVRRAPDLHEYREVSEASAENDYRVLMVFYVGPDANLRLSVVSIQEHKVDRTALVLVRTQNWPAGAPYHRDVIATVKQALARALPTMSVVVDDRVEGPQVRY